MNQLEACQILIYGIVQGVGFRPFIYRIANQHSIRGWVINTSNGVEIKAVGLRPDLDLFILAIEQQAPPLSRINSLQHAPSTLEEFPDFQILQSRSVEGGFQPISPDVSVCKDCLAELFSPDDFRYRYPFINCTNCGPRFTIIQDIPYDRPLTTMAGFELCPACESEYRDPGDRRFHAQPVACPACGPQIWIEHSGDPGNPVSGDAALHECRRLLAEGKIIAIKGLGGFHLACNALDRQAVQRLRERKDRPAKPLAVMMPNLETVQEHCQISKWEAQSLETPQRPILLLRRDAKSSLPPEIAPAQDQIGVMLPYTPLHYLLFSEGDHFPDNSLQVLVMTSANFSGNPILTDNQQVRDLLGSIADAFLFHDRIIQIHCDDSVARILPGDLSPEPGLYPIRRSRGFTPEPLATPFEKGSVLALGGELKSTFCMTKNNYVFLSQHIGDLKNYETLTSYQESIQHFEGIFRITPDLVIYDLHPDYLSTRFGLERAEREGLSSLAVQHHHAHIAACMADNNFPDNAGPVIGMAFDGTGYGQDGAIWGGEFLVADYQSYTRAGHLDYFPLPGGDVAVREPWRIALALLHKYDLPWDPALEPVQFSNHLADILPGVNALDVLFNQLKTGSNAPLTSSLGRLFDGVAALLGVCPQVSYEGQAAIELEALVVPGEDKPYPVDLNADLLFNPGPMLLEIYQQTLAGIPTPLIAGRFHETLAEMVLQAAVRIRESQDLKIVTLSGGVWQNLELLRRSTLKLRSAGFQVLLHHQVPANDGGISFGQAVIGQKHLLV